MYLRSRRAVAIVVGAVVLAGTLAACGDNGDGKNNTKSSVDVVAEYTTQPTAIAATEKLTKQPPTGLHVILVATQVPQIPQYVQGMKAAAKVLGWTTSLISFDQTNPATIASSIDSAIDQHPAAVIVIGLQNKDFGTAVAKAKAAGVKLISAVSSGDPEDGLYQAVRTGSRDAYGAKMLSAAIAADAKSSGKTVHALQLTVPAVAAVFKGKDEDFAADLKAACSTCTVESLGLDLPDVFDGSYTQSVVSAIQKNPDINYVVADTGPISNGLDAALKQAGLTNVKIYGFDAGSAQIQALQAGAPGAWTVASYVYDGWSMLDFVARLEVGDSTAAYDNEHVSYLLTADNADGIKADAPEFPKDYQQQFSTLWGR